MQKLSKISLGSALMFALAAMHAGQAQAQEVPSGETAPQAAAAVVVALPAAGGGEGSGEATLRPGAEGQIEVSLEVAELTDQGALSAFLVSGTCEAPGEVVASLGEIEVAEDGTGTGSAKLAGATLAELLAAPVTVQVHPQGDSPTQPLLCGAAQGSGM